MRPQSPKAADVNYTISLDGSGSGTGPFVLQAGDVATVGLSLTNSGTDVNDYSAFAAAVGAAVTAYNSGNASGTNNTFDFVGGVLTYTGDGTTSPELTFELTATEDALVEGDESFVITLANAGGSVLPIPPTVTIGNATVTTLITDNDFATWNIGSSTAVVNEGSAVQYFVRLDGSSTGTGAGPFVLQEGESATVQLSLTDDGTDALDYENFEAAVNALRSPLITALRTVGQPNTFDFT